MKQMKRLLPLLSGLLAFLPYPFAAAQDAPWWKATTLFNAECFESRTPSLSAMAIRLCPKELTEEVLNALEKKANEKAEDLTASPLGRLIDFFHKNTQEDFEGPKGILLDTQQSATGPIQILAAVVSESGKIPFVPANEKGLSFEAASKTLTVTFQFRRFPQSANKGERRIQSLQSKSRIYFIKLDILSSDIDAERVLFKFDDGQGNISLGSSGAETGTCNPCKIEKCN